MGRGVLALLWQLSSVQCRHLYSSAPTATIDANFYENYAPFRPKTSYEPDHSVPTYLCHTETAHRAIDQRLREKNFNFVLDIPNFPKNNPFIITSRYPDSSRYSWIRLQVSLGRGDFNSEKRKFSRWRGRRTGMAIPGICRKSDDTSRTVRAPCTPFDSHSTPFLTTLSALRD